MKKLLIVCASIIILFTASTQAQSKYVGAKVCASCHNTDKQGKIFDHWQQSNHSKAIKTLILSTESKARDLQDLKLWIIKMGRGDKYGIPEPAQESKFCLPCHSTAFGVDAKFLAKSFDPKDGIQCETCHGAGSAHVELQTIKNSGKDISSNDLERVLQLAKSAELKRFTNENEINDTLCARCHDGHCGDFDFDKFWPKIKHSVPKGQ